MLKDSLKLPSASVARVLAKQQEARAVQEAKTSRPRRVAWAAVSSLFEALRPLSVLVPC